MKIKHIVGAMLILFTLSANAADWYFVTSSNSGPNPVTFMVDKASISKQGQIVKYWRWTVFENNMQGNPPTDNGKVFEQINCHERTLRINSVQMFKGPTPVGDRIVGNGTYEPILPDSADESIFKTVCGGKFVTRMRSDVTAEDVQTMMRVANKK